MQHIFHRQNQKLRYAIKIFEIVNLLSIIQSLRNSPIFHIALKHLFSFSVVASLEGFGHYVLFVYEPILLQNHLYTMCELYAKIHKNWWFGLSVIIWQETDICHFIYMIAFVSMMYWQEIKGIHKSFTVVANTFFLSLRSFAIPKLAIIYVVENVVLL